MQMFLSPVVLHLSSKKVTEDSGKGFAISKHFLSSSHLSTVH